MIREIIGALIGYWIYPFSLITQRDKNKWCFGGTTNSKYLFLLTDFKSKGKRAIWYSNDKELVKKYKNLGYEAYTKTSLQGLYHLLTAKVYVITHGFGDVNRWTCGNVRIVNVWHGLPYKKISLSDSKHKEKWYSPILYPTSYKPFDLQVSTSPFVTKFFKESFKIRDNRFVEAMQPRNLILLMPHEKIINFLRKFDERETLNVISKIKSFTKVYIYMPTFRDSKRDFIDEAGFDFEQLESILKVENAMFIFKMHPETISPKLSEFGGTKHVMVLPKGTDVYPILPFTTGLITDYSSIYFDYILMKGKRVILYPFDYDEYKSKDRDFNFDSSYIKGEYCNNFNELLDCISLTNPPCISQDETIKLFWNNHTDTVPIVDAIEKLVHE